METLTVITKDNEVTDKKDVRVSITKEVAPEEQIATLVMLDDNIAGFDSNIAQAQENLDYWKGKKAALQSLRDRFTIEVDKVKLIK